MKRTKIAHVRHDKETEIWYFGEQLVYPEYPSLQNICEGCCFNGEGLNCRQPKELDCCDSFGTSLFLWKEIGQK